MLTVLAFLNQLCVFITILFCQIAQQEHVINVGFLQLILHYPVPNSESHGEFNDKQDEK